MTLLVVSIVLFAASCIFLVSTHKGRHLTAGGSSANPALPPASKLQSEVARQVHKEYMRLPADSRPFPDIVTILAGLDAKTSVDAFDRRQHFNRNWLDNRKEENGAFRFEWKKTYGCSHDRPVTHDPHGYSWGCHYHEYWMLHNEIQRVSDALDEKSRVLLASENTDATDMAKELVERLRSEASIQRQTTKELS